MTFSAPASLVPPKPSAAADTTTKLVVGTNACAASFELPVKPPAVEPLLPFAPRQGRATFPTPATGEARSRLFVVCFQTGQVMEVAPARELFADPRHPYTRALRGCSIELGQDTALAPIPGNVPPLEAMPAGCRFAPRCPKASERCAEHPPLVEADGRALACWNP